LSRIFISHSSANDAAALALGKWLSEQGYDDVFIDIDPNRGLVAGERWQEALKAAADRCEAVLFLVSPAWLASKWCLAEFLLAKTLHKRIFGLIIEPVPFERVPSEMTAEWQLCELAGPDRFRTFEVELGAQHQRVDFREAGLDQLRRGLARAGLDARSFPWPPPGDPKRAPYRGLRALEPQDAAIFFGRDAAVVRGLDRIRGLVEAGVEKLLVVLGGSGSGKSSFLRAGLWPRLARDDIVFLPLPVIRPETAVISGNFGLAVALAASFERLGAPRPLGRIKELLSCGSEAFGRLLDELLELAQRRLIGITEERSPPALIISIDQAEELFNAEGAAEATLFLQLLSGVLVAVEGEPRHLLVVATMRSDRYEFLQAEPAFAAVKQDLFNLPPMPAVEFKSVIEGPARRVVESGGQLTVDHALTERLIADAQGADALPLLAFTLERLYVDYGSEGMLTVAQYDKLGGVQGSIEAAIAGALSEPSRAPAIPVTKEEQLARLRAAFIPWLARIEPDSGASMRRLARFDEIPEESRAMVQRLVEARLIVADRRAGVDVVEVAHESLLRQWPALTTWLQADADNLKLIDGIERAASEWTRNGRNDAWLDHRAERLSDAERIAGREDLRKRLGEEGMAYLVACRTRENADRQEKEAALAREQSRLTEIAIAQARTAGLQRRARWSLAAIAMAVALGLGLALWQFQTNVARQLQLDRAKINLLAELSEVERLRGNLDSAMRFAAYSVRLNLGLKQNASSTSPANAALAAIVCQAGWLLTFSGHEDRLISAAFSGDGSRIVTASWDKTARVWDASTAKELTVLRGHESGVMSAVFSPDGKRVVTASTDKTARIWDAATEEELAVLRGHQSALLSATLNFDGTRIVTASLDKTARIWDAVALKEILVVRGHEGGVNFAAFNPDGSRVVTASEDKTARIWDAETGTIIVTLSGHAGAVTSAAFSPDGLRIVTASTDKTAKIWDVDTGKEAGVLRGHSEQAVSASFSPDGTKIITASSDRTVRVWNAATWQLIAVLRGQELMWFASYSPDGSRIITASADKTARIWSAQTGREIVTLLGHRSQVGTAMFSPDGSQIVTASEDTTARLWNAATGKEIVTLRVDRFSMRSAAFSPDGLRVVTSSGDGTARIWDINTGNQIRVLRGHENIVRSAAFGPDGSVVVTASQDGTARVWAAQTGKEIAVLRGHLNQVLHAEFSPDGSRIVTASLDRTARIWDAATHKEIKVLQGHESQVWWAAFSTDGSRIVTASWDKTARIWDSATYKEIAILRGAQDTLLSASFSPDGSRIVTSSSDKVVRILDSLTGKQIIELHGHRADVWSAAFNRDGTRIVSASGDGTARIWDVHEATMSSRKLLQEACTRLGRLTNFTLDEMSLAGYQYDSSEIDVCSEIE
jgi:WD40 repeat protein